MRVAVIGYGSIGKRHTANLVEMGHDVIVYDPSLEAAFSDTKDFTVSRDLMGIGYWRPDATIICTPPSTHSRLTREALVWGHAFVEKPLASRPHEAMEIKDLALIAKRHLAVGYQLRFHQMPFSRTTQRRDLTITSKQMMSKWSSQYEKDVLEEFSHEIDVALYLNGPVARVVATNAGLQWHIELQHFRSFSCLEIDGGFDGYSRGISSFNNVWQFKHEENDKAYKDQLTAFLMQCAGAGSDDRLCTGGQAATVVDIIKACRTSAEDSRIVRMD